MSERDPKHKLSLSAPFDHAWRGRDVFAEVRALEGEVFREVPGRRTLRFSAFGRSWFLKHHTGIGRPAWWAERLRGGEPVTGADNEWRAIRALQEAGIDTLEVAAFGQRGGLARRESFLITADLEDTIGEPLVDLETLCAGWVQKPPPPRFKRELIRSLAEISRRLHGAGITHRDYYLCHFLVPAGQLPSSGPARTGGKASPRPVLIDLHRALLQPRNLDRWVVKDLAGLLFSARHAGLTSRDIWRFIETYTGLSVREAWRTGRARWQRIDRRAEAMIGREQRRQQRVRSELLLSPPDGPVARWRAADETGRARIIRDLCVAVQRCHESGWLPVDRALQDIRELDGVPVIELTGAARVDETVAVDHARRANLADFLSWFPEALDRTLDDPERSPVPGGIRHHDAPWSRLVQAARRARWQRIAPALYRDTEQVRRLRRHGHVILHKRRLVSPDWGAFMDDPDGWMAQGDMIKDGDTTTVVHVTLGGQDCIVKRYNLVSTAHAVKRAPRPSRAWRHWYHAHRLLTLGAWTPEPLLLMERRWGPLRRQAWLVTEAVEGRNLLQDIGTLDEPATRQRVLAQFRDWFAFMRRHRVNHGDLKISNFISRPGGLVVLDLDGMRWPGGSRRFERGFRHDISRFMRNWQDRPALREEAARILRQADGIQE